MGHFKKLRGVQLPYRIQGKIYFTLVNYDDQPPNIKNRIDRLIDEAAGGDAVYRAALRKWLLQGESIERIVTELPVSSRTMYRLRKKIYDSW